MVAIVGLVIITIIENASWTYTETSIRNVVDKN